jgi:NTE family protein
MKGITSHARAACLLAGWLAAGSSLAEGTGNSAATDASAARPRIGLVLAGGGAKGGAHVGVLKVLEELHVPVDCIAGTSMGALVGGGYASGIPASDLEVFLKSIDWAAMVGGAGRRDLEPIEQKRSGETYSNNLELGLQDRRLVLPAGIVNTSAIEDLLRSYVARSRMQTDFDRLPIPFRAVATDMLSGRMVVLKDGDLATAMRASMAIPGAFAPVETEQYILSDGGMVRNIPVDVARQMCADVVIVVNLVEQDVTREQLRGAGQLLVRSTDVMVVANEELQLASLTDSDVRVDVLLGDIGTADFERVAETIPLGEAGAHKVADRLSALALPPEQYAAWRTSVTAGQGIEARLAGVTYKGLTRVNPEYLESHARVQPGEVVNNSRISKEAQRMSALQEFESVGYQLTGDPAEPTLEWFPKEKSWGPNYLKFDLGVYTSEGGDLAFIVYGKHTRTWINSLGAEWRNELQLGYYNVVSTSFYQPLDVAQHFFVEPRAFYTRSYEDVFSDNERLAVYTFDDIGAQVDFGANIGKFGQVRVGYLYSNRKVAVDTGPPMLPEVKRDDAGLTVTAIYDSRDTAFSPSRGIAAALEYFDSDDSLGAETDWQRIEAGLGLAVPFRDDLIWLTLAGGSNLGTDLPPDRTFALGGPGSFPGYELGEIRARDYWTTHASYLKKVKDILSIRGQALYAGFGLEAGRAYDRLNPSTDELIYSGSLYLAGRTMVGPLTLGVAATSSESWSLWLSVGRPIGNGTILERGVFR